MFLPVSSCPIGPVPHWLARRRIVSAPQRLAGTVCDVADEIKTRAGALLMWRLGPLSYGEQSRWARAPQPKGMWAFPWPFFDEGFAFHRYEYKMPARLRTNDFGWPAHPSWYRDAEGGTPTATPCDDDGRPLDGYVTTEGFSAARREWIRATGPRVVPRRRFLYSGDVFTHLRPNGAVGSVGLYGEKTDWFRMDAMTFAEAVRRSGANHAYVRYGDTVSRVRSSVDHLEVFLPAGGGRFHGRP